MKRLPYLPSVLLGACSAIILYVSMLNTTIFIPPQNVILPTVIGALIGGLLFLFALGVTRKVYVAGLIASIFVLGLLYIWPLFLAILGILIIIIIISRIILKNLNFEKVNIVFILVSLFISGYYFVRFLSFIFWNQEAVRNSDLVQQAFSQADLPVSSLAKPDIYYIILDGYGRSDMLQSLYGYDNSNFLAGLEHYGFKVAHDSRSNYPRTLLSLTSSLNMQYLNDLPVEIKNSNLWWLAEDAIQHSQVRQYLESSGYRTVFISSGWDLSDIRDGDIYLKPFPIMLNNFESAYISWTNLNFLGSFSWTGISFPSSNELREVILFNFDALPETSDIPGPKFVFAHIIAPHPPFLFNSMGKPVNLEFLSPKFGSQVNPETVSSYQAAYLGQLEFINKKTLTMVKNLLSKSAIPPIIILQADHGPDLFMNFNDPNKACLFERYSILNALYLPDVDPSIVPSDLSPVDTFRYIFNLYFHTNFEILQDYQYFSTNDQPYSFEDVTSKYSPSCSISSDIIP